MNVCARKRSSTCSASFRDWCWKIQTKSWMWKSLTAMIHPGKKSRYLIHRWSSGSKPKSTCSQTRSYVWEKFLNQQKQWKYGKDSWWNFQKDVFDKFYGINGEPSEFEWNIFPVLTSLKLLRKIQEYLGSRNLILQNLEIELSSCPSSTKLIGTRRTMKENVCHIPKKSKNMRRDSREDVGRSLEPEVKRSDMVHVYQSPKGSGTPWQHTCYNDSWRRVIQFSYRYQCSESWSLEKKEKQKHHLLHGRIFECETLIPNHSLRESA